MEIEIINKAYLELSKLATVRTDREEQLAFDLEMAQSGEAVMAQATKLYGESQVNRVHVIGMLRNMMKSNEPEFRRCFGSNGIKMLEKAISGGE